MMLVSKSYYISMCPRIKERAGVTCGWMLNPRLYWETSGDSESKTVGEAGTARQRTINPALYKCAGAVGWDGGCQGKRQGWYCN